MLLITTGLRRNAELQSAACSSVSNHDRLSQPYAELVGSATIHATRLDESIVEVSYVCTREHEVPTS